MFRLKLLLLIPIGCLAVEPYSRARFEDGSLVIGRNVFRIRGVAYSPPASACLYARDLPLLASMGANTVLTRTLLPDEDRTFLTLLGEQWPAFPSRRMAMSASSPIRFAGMPHDFRATRG
jgi:hypothetical protein